MVIISFRREILVALVAISFLASCTDDPGRPEPEPVRDGSNLALAIELPPDPPHPLPPVVNTRWRVLRTGTMWFENVTDHAMTVEVRLTVAWEGYDRELVGALELASRKGAAMTLDSAYLDDAYRDETWSVRLQHPEAAGFYAVGFY